MKKKDKKYLNLIFFFIKFMNTIHGKHINGVIMPRRNVVMSTVLFMNVKKAKKQKKLEIRSQILLH